MFHVRRRPADSQPRRRKKKPLGVSNGSNNMSNVEREGPMLVEITHSGDGGRRVKLGSEPIEVMCFMLLLTPNMYMAGPTTQYTGIGITQVTVLHTLNLKLESRCYVMLCKIYQNDKKYNVQFKTHQNNSNYTVIQ